MDSSPAALDVPRQPDPAVIGILKLVPAGPSTDPLGYAYPVQSATHFNFAGTAPHGSALHGDRKNGYPPTTSEQVVQGSPSTNGVGSSDYTSTATSINGNEKSSQLENDAAMDGHPAPTTTTGEETTTYTSPPSTPAAKGTVGNGALKTPTFAAGTRSTVHRRGAFNRRQRASTPHPIASPGTTNETSTTSPETTPEQLSKSRRKRRTRKPKVETTTAKALARSDEKTPCPESLRELPARSTEQVSIVESPVAEMAPLPKEVESDNTTVEQKSYPDAMTMEIEYPSFQTTAILEFEPDFPQPPALQPSDPVKTPNQAESPAVEPHISTDDTSQQPAKEDPTKPEPVKPKPRRTRNRFFRRYNRAHAHKHKPKPPPRSSVEPEVRPDLALLFERYGVHFANDKRPYLQFATLAAAARQRDPDVDVDELRGQFVEALKWDGERSWPGHQIMVSPIDLYFAGKDDGKIKTFQYDPTNEASVEFLRLAIEAGWIKEVPEWDVEHWNDSLKKFEEIWSKSVAKVERKKFREACFFEFDHLLGHIFRDTVGQYPNFKDSPDEDGASPPSMEWVLADYDRFLEMFGESPQVNIRESKITVRKLNLNLYDLLDWIRNPDTAARPERFINVRALAEYSFTHNKVFPFWHAVQSRIAHPFLRPLRRHSGFERTKRPRTFVVVSPVKDASKTESTAAQTSTPNDPVSASAEETLESSAEGVAAEKTALTGQVKEDQEKVGDTGEGASLFSVPEMETSSIKGIRVPTRRRRGFKRPAQDKVVLPSGAQIAITAPQ